MLSGNGGIQTLSKHSQKSKTGDCFLMIHVDDLLVVGTRKAVMEELIPALKTKYSVSVETMSKGGDEVSFLKRSHCLIDDEGC